METKKTQCHPHLVVNATCLLGEKGCYKNGKCHYIGNCEHKVLTHADRIRAMSDEEKAREFVFFCPTDAVFRGEETYGKPHYTGLDGKYYSTSEEVIDANLKWLKQPVGDE